MGLENPLHIAIILIVVLLVFGAKKLPEMGKGLGQGMRGFKSALSGEHEHEPRLQEPIGAHEPPAAATATNAEERTPEPVA